MSPSSPAGAGTAGVSQRSAVEDDVACYERIERLARRLLANQIGSERATYVAIDVWLWYRHKRPASVERATSSRAFRRVISRKLYNELAKMLTDRSRWDESAHVDHLVPDGATSITRRPRTPDELFTQGEAIWQVQRAIARLPRDLQHVVRLCDIEEWSAEEAAEELGLTPGNVRVMRHRARIKLGELLKTYGAMRAA